MKQRVSDTKIWDIQKIERNKKSGWNLWVLSKYFGKTPVNIAILLVEQFGGDGKIKKYKIIGPVKENRDGFFFAEMKNSPNHGEFFVEAKKKSRDFALLVQWSILMIF